MDRNSAFIFRIARSRAFCIALLAFQFLWLNVVVPGHRRGIVSLPGTQCPNCDGGACGATKCVNGAKQTPSHPGDPAGHCAICFFAAHLAPAVACDFTHPPLAFLNLVPASTSAVSAQIAVIPSYDGRAPPLAA